MANRSVLDRPRDLEEDIYDMTDAEHSHFNKDFYKYIIENYQGVYYFIQSDLWKRYVLYYRNKYETK